MSALPQSRREGVPTESAALASSTAGVIAIITSLERVYGPRAFVSRGRAVDVLVETVLSQNTSDVNSHRAFESLLARFGTLEAVAEARVEDVERAIANAGLSRIKSVRIMEILAHLMRENGSLDLSFLAERDVEQARKYLASFRGVGLKTASCVLLFSLGMPAMPVDTHVHRVSRRLGLIGPHVRAEAAHALLEAMVKPEDRYRLHILLIEHGRRVCRARIPQCVGCALTGLCPSAPATQA